MHPSTLLAGATLAFCAALPSAAHEVIYFADLSGAAEAPPNASPGTGAVKLTMDFDLVTMRVEASFDSLLGVTTAAHIHCCTAVAGAGTAGVATPVPSFPAFPVGVSSGSYNQLFDMSSAASYNPAFVAVNGGTVGTAFTAFVAGLDGGQAYLNLHTSLFPAGEIRGFLQPVPEPATYALMVLGLAAAGVAVRRQRACTG